MAKKSKENERIKDLNEQLKRALADYANLQKRLENEKVQFINFGKELVLGKFLQVLDTLEALEKAENPPHAKQGIELAIKQFNKILQEEGVEEISDHEVFDPSIHEAVEVEQGERENAVSAVVQKGFKLGDKILRPARVKVFKKEV
jgi:molecular chaperone GrpE